MTWTTTPPTVAGWYWLDDRIVEVESRGYRYEGEPGNTPPLVVRGVDHDDMPSPTVAQLMALWPESRWAGPLEPPA